MHRSRGAFTLLELATVLVIIAILSVMLLGAVENIRARVEQAVCINNLKTLHVAANGYIQQYGHWPQINPALLQTNRPAYEGAWLKALEPFGAAQKVWVCRTMSHLLGNEPDWKTPETSRLDYTAMPFDAKPFTPFQWSRQPWFVEKGNAHGEGNLIIFTDGHVGKLNDLLPKKP